MIPTKQSTPLALHASTATPRKKHANYPQPFRSRMSTREKHPLGDLFGLADFGVNLTRLLPYGESALFHRHSKQEEFIYILEGEPTLVTDEGEIYLEPGMCAGFAAGTRAHHLVNRTDRDVVYLEIGTRVSGDQCAYPKDNLHAIFGSDGIWRFTHKDGTSY